RLSAVNAQELDRLLTMLADIYRYKNNNKTLTLQRTNLAELTATVCAEIRAKNCDGPPSLADTASGEVFATCDPTQITTLLRHLIDNGIKHARTFVKVTVENDIRNQTARLIICDDGKGIRKEDQANLFDRFYTISTDRKHAPVTGTGLCLCGEIC